MRVLALFFVVAGPLAYGGDIDAVIAEDPLQLRDVGKPRHVVEDQRFLGQQARDHQRQRGILRARDRNGAVELAAADNTNAVHIISCPDYCSTIGGTSPAQKALKFAAI